MMQKIVLVGVLGYAVPRLVWVLIGKFAGTKLKSVAFLLTVAYSVTIIVLLIWPNIIHSIAFILLVIIAVADELFGWTRYLRKRVQRARKTVHHATKTDDSWDESSILQRSRELVNHYKVDWEAKDIVAISRYSTDRFSYHNRLFLEALNNLNRSVSLDANILELEIMNAQDVIDNEQDNFTLYVTTEQKLELLDNDTEEIIANQTGDIEEVYEVEREDDSWKLNASSIAHKGDAVVIDLFQDYAHKEGFYYNNRSSYLLLPYNDDLSFSVLKDCGHMILGVASNLLISIFLMQSTPDKHYFVASTTLPDKYPHVLIRSRETSDFKTDTLHRVSVEWPEFNENYDLFIAEPNSEKVLLSFLSTDLIKYLLSFSAPISVEIMGRNVYVIFASNEQLLSQSPEILSTLHRRALTSESTKALMR